MIARSLACRRCHRGWMNTPDCCSECDARAHVTGSYEVLDVAIASGGDGPDTARTPARSERPGETVPATVVSPPDPPGAPPFTLRKGSHERRQARLPRQDP